MKRRALILISLITVILSAVSCGPESGGSIEVFHKAKEPAMETLEKVMPMVEKYSDRYCISYLVITDEENEEKIKGYNLPDTHFPFAVVINGKYSARIEGKKVDFVHFPHFMHGIGRHEGNWSLEAMEKALRDNSLLLDKNVLPEIGHDDDEEECE